jgi:hypothetical protein
MSDTPKLWRDMTPEEKGALLLAQHEGKAIECLDPSNESDVWDALEPSWFEDLAYRVKPEPKNETATYICNGRTDGPYTLYPLSMAAGDTATYLPWRVSLPSKGGYLVPGVYTSEAGHTITVEGPK